MWGGMPSLFVVLSVSAHLLWGTCGSGGGEPFAQPFSDLGEEESGLSAGMFPAAWFDCLMTG